MKNIKSIKNALYIILFTALISSSWAQPPMPDIPASQESPAGMIALESEDDLPGFGYTPNIVYAKYGDTEVHIHLFSPGPSGPNTKPVPLIMYVPGSAWFPQNMAMAVPRMYDFAKQSGYAIAGVEYRPSTIAKSPAQLVDVKAAIRFMRANAKRYNIDPERVGIWGDSSGGHMAALVGVTGGMEKFETDDNKDQSSSVTAIADIFGPTDFLQMGNYPSAMQHNVITSPESSVIGGLITAPENLEKVREYNPITYVSKDKALPPILIMHGDKDPLVPFNQSVRFYEALKKADKNVAFYKIKGAGHYTRFYTPKTLKILQEFFDENL